MDRAYVAEANCGEIRLIYRLTRTNMPAGSEASSRLPMTLNVVLRAKGEQTVDRESKPITCAAIAERWLATSDLSVTGRDLAAKLQAKGGPLDLVMTNGVQSVHHATAPEARSLLIAASS